jgi:excisionase family DNA binding protein
MTAEFLGDLGGAQSPPAQRDDAGAEYPVAGGMAASGEYVDLALPFGIFWRASVKQFRHVLFTFPFGGWAASSCIPSLRNGALGARSERSGVSLPGGSIPALPGKEVNSVEDEHRKQITLIEAAEYLSLTPGQILDMVERGVIKADRFAGAVHIPREEVERIERETAP